MPKPPSTPFGYAIGRLGKRKVESVRQSEKERMQKRENMGGAVKVKIYEVDTKIAFKVDTFRLRHLCRHESIGCRSTSFDYVIYVDMD